MRSVDQLQLLVTPRGALGALVRAVSDLDWDLRQRLTSVGGVEDELGHLPVALVRVVEVVEGVEEPVLERELARIAGVGRDVGIDGGRGPGGQPARPPLVVATGIERVAGEVEVILVPVDEVARRRPDLDEIGSTPRTAQRDSGLVEEHVDVGRNVRLAGTALFRLIDEANDRGVELRQVRLGVRSGGGPRGCGADRCRREREEEDTKARCAHELNSLTGRRRPVGAPAGPVRLAVQVERGRCRWWTNLNLNSLAEAARSGFRSAAGRTRRKTGSRRRRDNGTPHPVARLPGARPLTSLPPQP